MTNHRASYLKTSLLVGFAAAGLIAVGYIAALVLGGAFAWAPVATWIAATPLIVVMAGGALVMYRDSRLSRGMPDLFVSLNRTRKEASLDDENAVAGLRWRRVLRWLVGGRYLLVGEWVTIRSFEEISGTLDSQDTLDGLPFLPEMVKFCGKRARVYRRVDKIYDYGGKKNLRRLRNAVLLRSMRCDGSAHDGCQAACYLIWKDAWLIPQGKTSAAGTGTHRVLQPQISVDATGSKRYTCQFTQLVKASTLLRPRDVRQDLRPIIAGNLTVAAAVVAWLTRVFNRVQVWRGGIGYPPTPLGKAVATPVVNLNLQPGATIKVLGIEAIGATLDQKGKNRGLWFDADMVKHCRQSYTVLSRVERIIDDANGLMRQMKTPCIVLDSVSYSGENLRFCFQEDPTFWREAWLSVGSGAPAATHSAAPANSGTQVSA